MGSVVIAPVITEAGMCERRHFSSNRTWITKLPSVLGVKAFGPVVQYCLECWFRAEYHRNLNRLRCKHKTVMHRRILFTQWFVQFYHWTEKVLWVPDCCQRLIFISAENWLVFEFHSVHFPLSAFGVYRSCIRGVSIDLLSAFLFFCRTKGIKPFWRHKHKGLVCIMSCFSARWFILCMTSRWHDGCQHRPSHSPDDHVPGLHQRFLIPANDIRTHTDVDEGSLADLGGLLSIWRRCHHCVTSHAGPRWGDPQAVWLQALSGESGPLC